MKVHADASGVKVRHTSPKKMYRVRVRYPKSLAAQQSVASQIHDMHDKCLILRTRFEQKLDLLTELRKSILHKAFTGELTVHSNTADRTLSEAGV